MDFATVVSIALGCVVAVLGWLVRRTIGDLDRKVAAMETELRSIQHDLIESKTRVESLRQSDDDLKEELRFIREHMVRRDDFQTLGERIDDVLKNQIPRTRRG